MLYRFAPLKISLDFKDSTYRLGDTLPARVEIWAKGDIEIREASISLVCDQKFVENYSVSGPGLYSNPGVGSPRAQIPNQVGSERIESYVHSSETFLEGDSLSSGANRGYDVRLLIDTNLPRRFSDYKALEGDSLRSWSFDWKIVVLFDVVRGRDQKIEKEVRVQIG